jgi:hypothetical protein
MKNVANCPKCGALFVKALRPICNPCYKEQEDNYDKVSRFMRRKQNRIGAFLIQIECRKRRDDHED